jgi:membrane protein YqaA with SNARE-associated domain
MATLEASTPSFTDLLGLFRKLASMRNRVARNVLLLMLAASLGAALGAVTKFSLGHGLGTPGTAKPEPMKSARSEP